MWPTNKKFGLHRVSIWVNIQKKFQVPRSHSIGEKYDANFKLSSHFTQKLCDQGTWNLVCKEYSYGLTYKKNFKFLVRTVSEKNVMITCKISKLFIRTIVQLWNFASYHRIFLEKCATEECEIWFAKSIHNGQYTKKISSSFGRTVSEKNAMLTCKISKLFISTIVQLWIFASYHRIFLEKCVTEEHEIWFAKSIHMG